MPAWRNRFRTEPNRFQEPFRRIQKKTVPDTGLHERGLNDVLDEGETAHAERSGQHGAEPAELVAKKVLH
jgi:hypothetical protein